MFYKKIIFAFFMVIHIVLCSMFPALADVNDFSPYTDSNAVSTFGMMRSSLGSVESSVDLDHVYMYVRLIDAETGLREWVLPNVESDGTYMYRVPEGYEADAMGFVLKKNALPYSGTYRFLVDHGSIASFSTEGFYLSGYKKMPNVEEELAEQTITGYVDDFSGDFYSDFVLQLGSIDELYYYCILTETLAPGSVLAGEFDIAFRATNEPYDVSLMVVGYGSEEYVDNVSSSISDLSSSVDVMNEGIKNVETAIQNLGSSMEPHYDNMLQQLQHITEQLHAFWDQLYNLHHTALLAKLDELKAEFSAANNSVKQAVDNMRVIIEKKLDSVGASIKDTIQGMANSIMNDYDESGLIGDSNHLNGALAKGENIDIVSDALLDEVVSYSDEVFPSLLSGLDGLSGSFEAIAFLWSAIYENIGNFSLLFALFLFMAPLSYLLGFR